MTQLATAGVSDRSHPEVQYVEPIYHTHGALTSLSGQIETLK